jgi:predicted nuclease with TOPRIM domain
LTLHNGQDGQIGGKMIKELEKQIEDLQKELADMKKEQSILRPQPCRGDSEIMKKDAKLDELDSRAKLMNRTLQDLERKRQVLIAESTIKGGYDSPGSDNSS